MTLTEFKQMLNRALVVLFIFLIAYFSLGAAWGRIQPVLFPPKIPPPEVAFGKLPPLGIPSLPLKEGSTPQYIVDTKTGRLPNDLPDRLKVYALEVPTPSPLSGQRAGELAVKLGFSGEPKRLSSSEHSFEDKGKGRTLKINITTGNFLLETDIKKLSEPDLGQPPSKAAAAEKAKNFLRGLNLLTDDYESGRAEATYMRIEGEALRKVQSLSEAQLTRVDLYREVEERPILGSRPLEGLIYVVLAEKQEPVVSFYSWPIDVPMSSTYPLRTVAEAWEKVQAGQAQTVFLGPFKGDPFASYEPLAPEKIYVRQIYLAYFDSEKFQDFLQPVYVFEGIGLTADRRQLKYIAYVPAIADAWLQGKE